MSLPPLSAAALFGGIIIGALSAYLAYRRGKNPYLWFGLGFLFGIFGLLFLFFTPKKKEVPVQEEAPLPTIQGPSNKFWYYLDPAQQQQGPMSLDALTAAWREGKIELSTYVWHEDLTDWKPLQEIIK
ncbi:MAG TPA: DUF4339 domain-containing protein [Chlamydiales bacterium]|nr:DUF4339 domain-containing protein [Chlamydiales bacterium]